MQLLRLFLMRCLSCGASTCFRHACAFVCSHALQRAFRALVSYRFYFLLTLRASAFHLRANISALFSEAHQYQRSAGMLKQPPLKSQGIMPHSNILFAMGPATRFRNCSRI